MDKAITASELRRHQRSFFDTVCNNHDVLLATRQNGENVVIMSEFDYLSLLETFHLLRSPKNRERLQAAMEATGDTYKSTDALFSDLDI